MLHARWCQDRLHREIAYGDRLLYTAFNITPCTGWHTSPFRHSSAASLLCTPLGLEERYFNLRVIKSMVSGIRMSISTYMPRLIVSRDKAAQVSNGIMIDHHGAPGHSHHDRDISIHNDPKLHDFSVCKEWTGLCRTYRTYSIQALYAWESHYISIADDLSYINVYRWQDIFAVWD